MRAFLAALLLWSVAATPSLASDQHCPKPGLGDLIEGLSKQASLSESDRDRLVELRTMMTVLAVAGDVEKARAFEEEAMRILGYEKTMLKCGEGSFEWTPIRPQSQP